MSAQIETLVQLVIGCLEEYRDRSAAILASNFDAKSKAPPPKVPAISMTTCKGPLQVVRTILVDQMTDFDGNDGGAKAVLRATFRKAYTDAHQDEIPTDADKLFTQGLAAILRAKAVYGAPAITPVRIMEAIVAMAQSCEYKNEENKSCKYTDDEIKAQIDEIHTRALSAKTTKVSRSTKGKKGTNDEAITPNDIPDIDIEAKEVNPDEFNF